VEAIQRWLFCASGLASAPPDPNVALIVEHAVKPEPTARVYQRVGKLSMIAMDALPV
jgi:hypothetical protein